MTIAELRELLNGATPGPWEVVADRAVGPVSIWAALPDDNSVNPVSVADRARWSDAALIVAAVNALPALLDVAEEAQAMMDRVSTEQWPCPVLDTTKLCAALAKLTIPNGNTK